MTIEQRKSRFTTVLITTVGIILAVKPGLAQLESAPEILEHYLCPVVPGEQVINYDDHPMEFKKLNPWRELGSILKTLSSFSTPLTEDIVYAYPPNILGQDDPQSWFLDSGKWAIVSYDEDQGYVGIPFAFNDSSGGNSIICTSADTVSQNSYEEMIRSWQQNNYLATTEMVPGIEPVAEFIVKRNVWLEQAALSTESASGELATGEIRWQ